MSIELLALFFYFVFLVGLIYGANNVNSIAHHPRAEQLLEKIQYNLRELPRVDYTEPASEEECSEEDEQSSPSEDQPSTLETNPEIRKRYRDRDPNAFGRMMEVD